jgi:ABC-type lipoprotein release transport system permease subunit
MNSSAFLNFVSLLLFKNRSKHLAIFLLSTLLIFLLSSSLFIVSSLKHTLYDSLAGESDFIIQKVVAGKAVNTPLSWQDALKDIKGISAIGSRLYGRYLLPDEGKYFTIVGVDFFDEQVTKRVQKLSQALDIKSFLSRDQMIVGAGVASYLKSHYYEDYFNFITPKGEEKRLFYTQIFPPETSLLSNDTIIMPIALAREILGVEEDKVTDIILNVANEAERENIAFKLRSLHFDARVVSKDDIKSAYDKYYNYKSGLFLLLFILTLSTFMLILYQRYAMVGSSDKREIAILRMMGWSIKDVLKLKLYETLFIGLFSFLLGVILAYIFVFFLNAPLLRDIFIGFGNLDYHPQLQPVIDSGLLSSLFLFFITPFILSVIIPVWRIAIIDPYEGMK